MAQLLSKTKVTSLLVPKTVVTIDSNASLSSTLDTLSSNHIISAPVYDGSTFLGLIDVLDVLTCLVAKTKEAHDAQNKNVAQHKDPEAFAMASYIDRPKEYWLTMATNLALKVAHAKEVRDFSKRNPFVPLHIKDDPTLEDVAEVFAQGVHRVPIVDDSGIHSILSQSTIIDFLQANLDQIGEAANKTVEDLHLSLGNQHVKKCAGHIAVLDAFTAMCHFGVPAVVLVDDEGRTFGVLSATDLKSLVGANLQHHLALPVVQYIEKVRVGKPPHWVVTVTPHDTLARVISLLAEHHVHRVFVVDKKHHPIGVVSLTDVLRVLVAL